MKIQEGKFYVNSHGLKAGPMTRVNDEWFLDPNTGQTWRENGLFLNDPASGNNLVAEMPDISGRIKACLEKRRARKPVFDRATWRPKVGDKCKVRVGHGNLYCDENEVIEMSYDDGTESPKFRMKRGEWYVDILRLEPA